MQLRLTRCLWEATLPQIRLRGLHKYRYRYMNQYFIKMTC